MGQVGAQVAPGVAVAVRVEDHATILRMLARRHTQIAWMRNKAAWRLHALVGELVPGVIRKELVVAQASRLLEAIEPVGAVATERHLAPEPTSLRLAAVTQIRDPTQSRPHVLDRDTTNNEASFCNVMDEDSR